MNGGIIKAFDDNLVLRAATAADANKLAEFNAWIHSDDGPEKPEQTLGVWTCDLLLGSHPTFKPGLTTIVEDSSNGMVVSTALIIPQVWAYEGIPFGVGRPELIATHPDYRGRGLVRAQMDTLHEWSAALGHKMQAITGIPWFYRQFGYEMGLDLGGGREAYHASIPALKPGEIENYTFRPATLDDVPFFVSNYGLTTQGERLVCLRSSEEWAYEIAGKSIDNHNRMVILMIENRDKRPVGYAVHPQRLSGRLMELYFAGITGESTWHAVTPALLRHLQSTGNDYAQRSGEVCDGVYLSLGPTHPIYEIFTSSLPKKRNPYAWYVRIANLPDFISTIAPVMEKRLLQSHLRGFSGEVRLSFYRSGVRLVFDDGRLSGCEVWQPGPEEGGDARFPDLTFLSLLCGRRSFRELENCFPDCFAKNDETASLLNALFPAQPSNVWGIE